MSFSQEFLKSQPQYPALSERQQEIFLCVFGEGSDWTIQKRSQTLSISKSNIRTHLTEIYKKFGVPEGGHGKENWLRTHFWKKNQTWQENNSTEKHHSSHDIQTLIQDIRDRIRFSIQSQCGTMRILDMNQPILLGDIYTDVNILEKTTATNRYDIDDLDSTAFDRWGFGKIKEERVSGFEAVKRHSQLMILGKPGAGKTTFLKYLAIQSIEGTTEDKCHFADSVPLFITLKDFSESEHCQSLFDYLIKIYQFNQKNLDNILKAGRALVLLDGLDEVLEVYSKRVNKCIESFAVNYGSNKLIVTCRIASKNYIFQNFIETEVADFNEFQIKTFVRKWFESRKKIHKIKKFLMHLKENKSIWELANSPLLLTLLCLIFEEKNKFYSERAELYSEGIELLLEKWDNSRDIERDEIYKNLSVRRRKDMLSKLALNLFIDGEYFFKKHKSAKIIESYISHLSGESISPRSLDINSMKILRSIQSQHGLLVERAVNIYSFSHLTFHEYFAAREIIQLGCYRDLASHICDERWREVFLLTTELMSTADSLLLHIKEKIEDIVVNDSNIQRWLSSYAKYSSFRERALHEALALKYSSATVKYACDDPNIVLYSDSENQVEIESYLETASSISRQIFGAIETDWPASDIEIIYRILNLSLERHKTNYLDNSIEEAINSLIWSIDFEIEELKFDIDEDDIDIYELNNDPKNELDTQILSEKQNILVNLNKQLPENAHTTIAWHEINEACKGWHRNFKEFARKYYDIQEAWIFNETTAINLEKYFKANRLLLECLNSDCYVNQEIRKSIEDTLLLPLVEIDNPYSE